MPTKDELKEQLEQLQKERAEQNAESEKKDKELKALKDKEAAAQKVSEEEAARKAAAKRAADEKTAAERAAAEVKKKADNDARAARIADRKKALDEASPPSSQESAPLTQGHVLSEEDQRAIELEKEEKELAEQEEKATGTTTAKKSEGANARMVEELSALLYKFENQQPMTPEEIAKIVALKQDETRADLMGPDTAKPGDSTSVIEISPKEAAAERTKRTREEKVTTASSKPKNKPGHKSEWTRPVADPGARGVSDDDNDNSSKGLYAERKVRVLMDTLVRYMDDGHLCQEFMDLLKTKGPVYDKYKDEISYLRNRLAYQEPHCITFTRLEAIPLSADREGDWEALINTHYGYVMAAQFMAYVVAEDMQKSPAVAEFALTCRHSKLHLLTLDATWSFFERKSGQVPSMIQAPRPPVQITQPVVQERSSQRGSFRQALKNGGGDMLKLLGLHMQGRCWKCLKRPTGSWESHNNGGCTPHPQFQSDMPGRHLVLHAIGMLELP